MSRQTYKSKCARLSKAAASAIGLLLLTSHLSLAGQGSVNFTGTVSVSSSATCTIVIENGGEIVPNTDSTLLSSRSAGGSPGVATVYSLLNHSLTVDAPVAFRESPDPAAGTSFSTYFSGRSILRGRTFNERPGSNQVRLRRGLSITRIEVDLEASNTNGFEAGDYTAEAVIRCE